MAGRSETNNIIENVDTCMDAIGLIFDYLNGELNEETNKKFEKHLEVCPDCVSFLNTYKKTLELTKSFLKTV